MALIKCPRCQKDVSSMVSRCPFCNADLTRVKNTARPDPEYYNHTDSGSAALRFSDMENSQTAAISRRRPETQNTAGSETNRPRVPGKRKKNTPPPGRRLLGYRTGNPIYMFLSIFYHMAACVGILYAISFSQEYWGRPALLFHICRILLASVMLFLPVLFLSENKLRRKVPLLRRRKSAAVMTGFVILYIPLIILFSICCLLCS